MTWRAVAAVALGGGLGSVLRYAVGMAFTQWFGPGFPWGTLVINVAGSFAIGVISELAQTRALGFTPTVRIFATVGVLGGFTTFSTFSLDMVTLAGERAQALAFAYGAGSVILGFAAAFTGIVLVRLMLL